MSPLIRELESVLRGTTGPRADRLHTALRELAALDEVLAAFADDRGLNTTTASATAMPPAAASTPPPRRRPPARRRPPVRRCPHSAGRSRPGRWRAYAAGDGRLGRVHPAGHPQDPDRAEPRATGTGSVPDPAPRSGGAVTVTGTVRCPDHPEGCDAWITVVSDRGKRRARPARSTAATGSAGWSRAPTRSSRRVRPTRRAPTRWRCGGGTARCGTTSS
ncbi:hypothetical protein NKH77_54460 [Streptomyces sp. M19]